jgi:nicotinamidase/pyrazinamidase
LVVDVQRDFCPGGALAVKGGDEVVPPLNHMIASCERLGVPIYYSRDWHPPNHMSFQARGGPWPPHCVQGTPGAEFHGGLRVPLNAIVISKGEDPNAEAYSAFQGTDLEKRLKKAGVSAIVLGGLTTDYCVKETTIDARLAGFEVEVLEDCTRAVNVNPEDGAKALAAIRKAGAKLVTTSQAIRQLASTQQ